MHALRLALRSLREKILGGLGQPSYNKVRATDEIRLSRTAMLDESNSGSRMHDSMLASRSRRFRIALSGRESPKSSIDDHGIN